MAAAEALSARDKVGVQDFVLLEDFRSEDAFLENLRKRFKENLIYTYIGPVIVSVNPYKDLNLYTRDLCIQYRGINFYELPPHVFAVSDTAYRSMKSQRRDQCVLISGESGAGKTEASKQILRYLATVSTDSLEVTRIKDRLLQSNPVLEAFGNAKTVRNDNSSRFGKYMDIQFDFKGAPVGGHILNYLLEKSRVVQQSRGERNFHIFYQVLQSKDAALLQRLSLSGKITDYRFVASTINHKEEADAVFTLNDTDDYKAVKNALPVLGFSADEVNQLFSVIAAILHLGNVSFVAERDLAKVDDPAGPVSLVAKLLGTNVESMTNALTHKTIEARGEKVTSPLSLEEAFYARDATAKAVYERMFSWLVGRVNTSLEYKSRDPTTVMGLLDIYGFEVFGSNSFEQFCINYCNEKLQQIFIELTLKSEQEEYLREGIEWEQIEYFNNKVILDLIDDKQKGIISCLDEECLRPGDVSDVSFLSKLTTLVGGHEHFTCHELADNELRKTLGREDFRLKHYAGDVTYQIKGFIDKNNDLLFRDVKETMSSSQNVVMSTMFPQEELRSKKRPTTAATQFKVSLGKLAEILMSKEPSYVRCIKPNSRKVSAMFENDLVRHQVKYLGLMENLRVRRAGFAYRRDYEVFLKRYKSLCPDTWPDWDGPAKAGVEKLAKHLGWTANGYRVGKTKVFIRQPATLFGLEEKLEQRKHELATEIQAMYRMHRARTNFILVRLAVTRIAANWRRVAAVRLKARRRAAAAAIRRFIRGFITRMGKENEYNVKFQRYVRYRWLMALSEQLPKTVLDKEWPPAPPLLTETSKYLRGLHLKWMVRRYCTSMSPQRKALMELKVKASELFRGRKQSYGQSLPKHFVKTHLDDGLHSSVSELIKAHLGADENVLVSMSAVKYDRHGYKPRERLLACTNKSVVMLVPGKLEIKESYALSTLSAVTVSSLTDGLVVFRIKPAEGTKARGDLLLSTDHTIELCVKLADAKGDMSVVDIVSESTISHDLPGNKQGAIRFSSGPQPSIAKSGKELLVVAAQ